MQLQGLQRAYSAAQLRDSFRAVHCCGASADACRRQSSLGDALTGKALRRLSFQSGRSWVPLARRRSALQRML